MRAGWRDVQLGDVISIKHGYAFKGSFFRDEPQGDILLTPGNFAVGGGFKGEKLKYYDGSIPEDFILREGDLLVTMTDLSKQSDTLGYPAFVPASSDGRRYLHNQRLGKTILKNSIETDLRFIYYVMCSDVYRDEVLAGATGTTVKHTSPGRIAQFRFRLPPLVEQQSIAHILGTLDDKIELNRRMNQTLEEMARALFKSWFVDFDPVRAKAALERYALRNRAGPDAEPSGNGGAPAGQWTFERGLAYLDAMDPQIVDLFPDRLVDSELGEIPEGWEVRALGELFELAIGGVWGKDAPDDKAREPVQCLRGIDCHALAEGQIPDAPLRWITARQLEKRRIPAGTILLEGSGSFCGRSLLWRGRLGELFDQIVSYSNFVKRLDRSTCSVSQAAVCWQFIRQAYKDAEIQNYRTGTAFPNLDVHALMANFKVVVPPEAAAEVYVRLGGSGPSTARMDQAHALAELRDSLLPRLVSGRISTEHKTSTGDVTYA